MQVKQVKHKFHPEFLDDLHDYDDDPHLHRPPWPSSVTPFSQPKRHFRRSHQFRLASRPSRSTKRTAAPSAARFLRDL